MSDGIRRIFYAAAAAAGLALALWAARQSVLPPPELPAGYPTHEDASKEVGGQIAAWLKSRPGQSRLVLLEPDAFDRQVFAEWDPASVNLRLCEAVRKGGFEDRVYYAGSKDTVARTVEFLQRSESKIYDESVYDRFGSAKRPDMRLMCQVAGKPGSEGAAELQCSLFHLVEQRHLAPARGEFILPAHAGRLAAARRDYALHRSSLGRSALAAAAAAALLALAAAGMWVQYRSRRKEYLASMERVKGEIKDLITTHSYDVIGRKLDAALACVPEETDLLRWRNELKITLDQYGGDALLAEKTEKLCDLAEAALEEGGQLGHEPIHGLESAGGARAKALLGKARAALAIGWENEWRKVAEHLSRGETGQARKALDALLAARPEHEAGRKLDRLMRVRREDPPRRLKAEKMGKDVLLMHADSFVVGREPKELPSIAVDNADVSRSHLRLAVQAGRLLAEDLDSKFGSALGGESFKRAAVEDGSILLLGKSLRVEVHLCFAAEDGSRAAPAAETRLDDEPAEAAAPAKALAVRAKGPLAGFVLEFPRFYVLWGRVRVSFGPAGIVPDAAAGTELWYRDGVLLAAGQDGYEPCLDASVERKGVRYLLEG
ncbi:MAG: FHA domain-containing protein [Elusimicrobia bacterium]|nr:FHA domain-containing protein [Elusimicrobiota bacterium]